MAKPKRVPDPKLAAGIQDARTATGLSQRLFAIKCGVTEQTVYKWEHDEVTPTVTHLRKIRRLGKMTWEDLLD